MEKINFCGDVPAKNALDNTEAVSKGSNANQNRPSENALERSPKADAFKKTKKGELKVNPLRIWFHRLTQDQIDAINETRALPKNMKVRPNPVGTGFHTYHNIFNLYNGTKTLPDGYELRKNILGFTRLVPNDTEGFWLKKK